MASPYIQQQRQHAAAEDSFTARLNAVLAHCHGLTDGALPPEDMMNVIGSHDRNHFVTNMVAIFEELARRTMLPADAHVLDLGCGCGRLAIPFCAYLEDGRYYGVDVWADGIDWCRHNLAMALDRADFAVLPAADNYYFRDTRSGQRNEFRLPMIVSSSVDLAFAISVFTHLVRRDCLDFLTEFARVLKPDGVSVLTGFVIDRFFFEHVERTGHHQAVAEEEPGCFYAYSSQDFFAGYTMELWMDMFEAAGLTVLSWELGKWAGKPGARPFQDTFVVMRKP